jgi:hypothetical protein
MDHFKHIETNLPHMKSVEKQSQTLCKLHFILGLKYFTGARVGASAGAASKLLPA